MNGSMPWICSGRRICLREYHGTIERTTLQTSISVGEMMNDGMRITKSVGGLCCSTPSKTSETCLIQAIYYEAESLTPKSLGPKHRLIPNRSRAFTFVPLYSISYAISHSFIISSATIFLHAHDLFFNLLLAWDIS